MKKTMRVVGRWVAARSSRLLVAGYVAAVAVNANAAGGLARAASTLNNIRTESMVLIGAIATLALLVLFVGFALKMVHFRDLGRWAFGIIGAGCVAEIVAMVFTS